MNEHPHEPDSNAAIPEAVDSEPFEWEKWIGRVSLGVFVALSFWAAVCLFAMMGGRPSRAMCLAAAYGGPAIVSLIIAIDRF